MRRAVIGRDWLQMLHSVRSLWHYTCKSVPERQYLSTETLSPLVNSSWRCMVRNRFFSYRNYISAQQNLDTNVDIAKKLIEDHGLDTDDTDKQHRVKSLLAAKALLQTAALANHNEAKYQLGSFYLHFPNLELDILKKPAENHVDVLKEINVIKVNNRRKRKEKRVKDLNISIEAKISEIGTDPLTASELKNMSEHEQAFYWLRSAAHDGHGKSMCLLANTLMKAEQKRDVEEAMYWYRKAAMLDPPVTEALYNLGVIYGEGNDLAGVKADLTEAVEYFERAARLGDADAHYWLGHTLSSGEFPTLLDPQKAVEHFKLSSQCGHGNALYRLALLFRTGVTRKSIEEELRDQGSLNDSSETTCTADHHNHDHQHGLPESGCQHLGSADVNENDSVSPQIADFDELPANHDLFIEYLQRAIHEDNDPNAITLLGEMKLNGSQGLPSEEVRAYELFMLAHQMGHAHASFCLGVMHYRGLAGHPKDPEKAFEYYNIAAEGGSVDAWRCLASMYYLGDGVAQCQTTAKEIMRSIAKM